MECIIDHSLKVTLITLTSSKYKSSSKVIRKQTGLRG